MATEGETPTAVARSEWSREAFTMAFYVAIVLIAALVAIDDDHRVTTLGLIWGTTVGLALAHLFAFQLASRLVGERQSLGSVRTLAGAQLTGAVAIAVVSSLPVLFLSEEVEADAVRLVLSALIALAAFAIGRNSGASTLRSAVFSGLVLLVGTGVAVVKNLLLGH